MTAKQERDVEKEYPKADFVAKRCRLAPAEVINFIFYRIIARMDLRRQPSRFCGLAFQADM